jgi:hypothetical protein
MRFLPLLLLTLWPRWAQADSMGLLGHRWLDTQQGIPVWVGHHEAANMDRPAVVGAVQGAMDTWTDRLGGPTFLAVDGHDAIYSYTHMNNKNTVCWQFLPGGTLGTAACFTSSDNYYKRVKEMDIVLSSGSNGYPDYCWFDCQASHPGPCGNDTQFDVQSVLLHEFGHGLAGLNHYDPCSWSSSVMFGNSDGNCARHRALGSVDREYAAQEFEGISSDLDEPADDGLSGATDLGSLHTAGDSNGLDGHRLPGLFDIDFYRCDVGSIDGCILDFTASPYDGTDLCLVVYKDYGWLYGPVDVYPGGHEESWQTTAAPGRYWIGVFTADGMPGGEYSVVMDASRMGTSSLRRPAEELPEFAVRGQEIRGGQLRRADQLDLYGVDGRRLTSWEVPAREPWRVSLESSMLARGVYFARLRLEGHGGRKIVVVR